MNKHGSLLGFANLNLFDKDVAVRILDEFQACFRRPPSLKGEFLRYRDLILPVVHDDLYHISTK